ncbi:MULTISPECIES: BON domain-containing protein [unclassified Desulfovibrio]|uniref:BON domain-containing protein n=1 Tax=unclassified Desulfovibrio TaxID=2593640 RepID=UPI002FDA7FC0
MQRLALILLLFMLAGLNGCAYGGYGLYDDQRLMDTISDDKGMATKIKTALMNESFTGGWSVAVYSFYRHVFLVGEVPPDMQGKALTIARRYNPLSVTPHWFTPGKSDTSNIVLATKLRKDLIGTKGLSSTRIDTEVNAGRVVLLGVVKDDAEKQLAIQAARAVPGVTSVTSYLMLPQKAGQLGAGVSERHEGMGPADGGFVPDNASGSASGSSGGMNTSPAASGGSSGTAGNLESRDLP